jgi:hypothetical protein
MITGKIWLPPSLIGRPFSLAQRLVTTPRPIVNSGIEGCLSSQSGQLISLPYTWQLTPVPIEEERLPWDLMKRRTYWSIRPRKAIHLQLRN